MSYFPKPFPFWPSFFTSKLVATIKQIIYSFVFSLLSLFIISAKLSFAQNTNQIKENVAAKTRAQVEALRGEYAGAKLSQESEECLAGILIDPECDALILDEVRLYRKKQQVEVKVQQVEAKVQQVEAKVQQVNIALEATEHIGITIALIQLAMFIDFNKVPPKEVNHMDKIFKYKAITSEVRSLFSEFLERKKRNDTFTWKSDEARLMSLAGKHLDIGIKLQEEITDGNLKSQISSMVKSAQVGLKQTYDAISNNKK